MNRTTKLSYRWLCLAGAAALTTCSFGRGAVQMRALPDSVLQNLSRARLVGTPNPNEVLYLAVSLKPRFPAELQAFCDSVSDPFSPNYHHFMTPEQVGENFGASPSDVNSVVSY